MSETQSSQEWRTVPTPESTVSLWFGWVFFAGAMLILLGAFEGIAGLVALLEHQNYAVRSDGLVAKLSYTAWGWIHMGFGALAAFAGYGLFVGKTWARIFAVVLCCLIAIAAIGFLNAAP